MSSFKIPSQALLLSGLLTLVGFVNGAAGKVDKTLQIYWVDVEGGAATLIVTPEGESVLIDTGLPGVRDPERIHKAAKEAGLEKIDHLITSHFHLDHFGGAAELSALMPIRHVWDNGIPEINPDKNRPNDRRFPRLIAPYREMDVQTRHVIEPGDFIPLSQTAHAPAFSIQCLAAQQKILSHSGTGSADCDLAEDKEEDLSDNANSIVLVLKYGNFVFFNGGDLTWNVERRLVCPNNVVGDVDVYQVNHHGLDVSNNPVLVNNLAPTVSVMSNGTKKGCGASTFKTLTACPSIKAMYQIHKNLRDDSENNTSSHYIANESKNCEANLIRLTVSPDGATYTVSIPAKNHHRLFATKRR